MSLQDRNYHLLIVSASASFRESMTEILNGLRAFTVRAATNVAAARRMALESTFDLVVVNAPLPDEFGSKFAAEISAGKSAVSLLIVPAELYQEVVSRALDYGVYVLPKPLNRPMAERAIEWMCATRERIRRMEKKTLSLEEKMEEIRIVNHAKWLLIDRLKMSESDAHRYLEKQAMDRCVSRREIAEGILRTYS